MYCSECGGSLIKKECGIDGLVDYCPRCKAFRFPTFSSGVSVIVLAPDKREVLLIKQYGRPDYILVAGYIMKGENAHETAIREVGEETGLRLMKTEFNNDEYFAPSNTLMHNFVAVAENKNCVLNEEVDEAAWFSFAEALKNVKKNSLAERFLAEGLKKIEDGKLLR